MRFTLRNAKIITSCLLAIALLVGLPLARLSAQNVNVAGALVGNGTYATLGAAFSAINGGAQGGASILVTVVNNTNEGAATAVLNQSATPWTSLTIQPSGGAWTITGATTAGSPLLDLNGADNVTIDGLNSGGNALTIQNTTVSSTSGTSTIRFITDATNNVITRCAIQGSSTMTTTTNGATIWFAAGAVTTGNDNNTISFCNIGPAGTNLPSKAIYANGSTGSTTLYNSGNQFLNNNIFDFFNAASQCNGIYLAGGNTDYTINNNRFYETAARTHTTGAIIAAIQVASANNNNITISGNTIGFANAAGTGTLSLTTLSGSRFYGIYFSAAGTTTTSNITGNTISNISLSGAAAGTGTTSPLTAILIGSGLATMNNNIIGSQVANGALSFTTTSTSASEVMAIYNVGSSTTVINGNTIGGITAGNSSTGAVNIFAIRVNTLSSVTSTIQNNQIGGAVLNSIQNTAAGSTTSSVIGIQINLSASTITGNSIGSMSTTGGAGTALSPSVGGIVVGTSSANHTVSGNTIGAIGNLNPATTGHISGIAFTGSTGVNLVSKNNINSLIATSPTAVINGIFVSGGTATYANNMIRLGLDPTGAAIATGIAFSGISETGGIDNFYHNSVYLGGTGVTGTASSFAFQSTVTTSTRNYQNNIFYNARSNGSGTGKHYAIRVGGTAALPAGLTSNFNILLANGTGSFLGLFNAVDQATIANWRTATGHDNNSINLDPNFVLPNGTSLSGDLHINNPTPIESNGTPIAAVTDDFDGQVRSALSPVDIGADAGNFVGSVDLAPPAISYTALSSTCTTGDRILSTTIVDASGVPTAGLLQPRIYFKKNAGAYVSAQGVLTSGSGTNGTWDFTISAAAMGGLVASDVVSYYVIAQDIGGPNITAQPSAGLVATDVNTVTTPPTSPNTYNIAYNLSGTYTVGATGAFPTLTAAVNAYNVACLVGPVVFELIDNTYASETFPISIAGNVQASSVNTLTIKPTLANTTISGSSATAIILFNAADYVTLDGSIGTTANTICPRVTASRDLTITNTNTGTSSAIVWLQNISSDGPTNNKVLNCNLVGNSNTTTLYGVGSGSAVISTTSTGFGNNNNAIVNNNISKTQYGIYSQGQNATTKNTGNVINLNLINTLSPNNVARGGIQTGFEDNITISGNTVGGMSLASSPDVMGISVGFTISGFSATTSAGNEVTNATVTHNIIGSIVNSGTFSAVGLGLASAATGTSTIANNMISGVAGNGTSGDFSAGIVIGGGAGTINLYHNTVSMQGTIAGGTGATQVSACLAVTASSAPTSLNILNNIFSNTQAGNSGATLRFVAIGYQFAGPFTAINCNYNNLFSAGAGPGTYFIGTTAGLVAGTTAATLANWQTATGGSANSVNIAPVFASTTDLHLPPASNGALDNIGTALPAVTTDIDCESRSATAPDMGADEFINANCVGTPTAGTATATSVNFCLGGSSTLNLTGFSIPSNGLIFQWMASANPGGPYTNIPGANSTNYTFTPPIAGVSYVVCEVTCPFGGSPALSNELTITVNPALTTTVSPTSGTYCTPGGPGVTLTASSTGGTGAVSYSWTPNTTLVPSSGSPVVASPATSTTYVVTGTDAAGCTATASTTIGTAPSVTLSGPTATPATICEGFTSALNVSASIAATYSTTTVPFAPIASGSGTTLLASAGTASTALTSGSLDDGYWNGIALPFSFSYFGTSFNTLNVGTNGYLSFTAIGTTTGYSSSPQMPNTATPNNIIGGCFGDLDWGFGGVISTYTSGIAPNRIFVINFDGSTGGGFYNSGSLPTFLTNFQIQLHEGTNLIQVHTTTVNSNTSALHTMGIENVGGTAAVTAPGRSSSLWSLSNNGTQFTPSGIFTYAWTPATGLTPTAVVANPTTPALTGTTTYNVTVTDALGCSATGSTTVTVNPTVIPTVSISVSPSNTICAGDNATFTATPINGGTTPIYQWFLNASPVGTNSNTYSNTALVSGDVVNCQLTSNANCSSTPTAMSNNITMTVNPLVVPSVSIASNLGTTICAGDNVTFTASPVNGGASPTYQWLKNSSPVGTNSATYSDNGLVNGDVISLEMTSNAICPAPATVMSNTLTMVVNSVVANTVTISASPSTTICAGDNVTFTAVASNPGGSPVYQWLKNSSPVGTNSASYSDNGLVNGDVISLELTSSATCASPLLATSNTLTMTVNPILVPSVSIVAAPSTTICAGTSVTFTASAVNGGASPSYQWLKNSAPVGTNSATYTDNGLINGDMITVELTSNATCAAPALVSSNVITMIVNPIVAPAISISANPGTTICAGTNVDFTASPTNGGVAPSYQWFLNSAPVGANSNTYSNGALVNGDVLTCEMTSSNACAVPATAMSNTLTISVVTNVTPAVSITVNPGTTICPSGSATFTALAVNAGTTPSYQWFLNSNPVGANAATYTNGTLVTGDFVECVVTSSDPCALPTFVSSNTITMTVHDVTLPVAVCNNLTLSLNAGGTASTTATAINNGSSDNCTASGSLGFSLSASAFTCANLGINSVVLSVTDLAGNVGTCSATITINDNLLPVITCPANISVNNTVGVCSAIVNYSSPIGTDNCSVTTAQTTGLASAATFPLGVTTNTFRATDAAGNTATCAFTVTVVDNQLPSITCPANISVNSGVGVCSAVVSYSTPVGTDNCSGATTTQTTGLASAAIFPVGVTTNTFRATDAAGNTATCAFTVTVVDNQLPAITCPANISVNSGVGVCSAVVSYSTPVGTDNCSGATTTQTTGLASAATFPVGVTSNTFRATDAAGNTATCAFTVTVVDNQLPAITCPANISVNSGAGVCSATVSYTAPVGTDNCSGATTSQTAGLASAATFPVGVTTNTFLATDAAGNTATCSFTVTVIDAELPAITCPANISVNNDAGLCSAAVTYSAPVGTDNCSGATTTQTTGLASAATFPVGITTNIFLATDAAGNTASCSFTVTVADAVLPVFAACPSNLSVSTSPTTCDASVTWIAPVATDNCSLASATSTNNPGDVFAAGTTTVTYTAVDAAGNASTCSFTVTVTDSVAPTALCQNVTVTLVGGVGATTAAAIDNGSTDGCGISTLSLSNGNFTCADAGANTVVLSVTDLSGNVGTCSAVVTVVAPAVTATVSATVVNCGYNVSCNGATDGEATVTPAGGCGTLSFLWSNGATTATATGLAAGTYTVTVTDLAGGTTVSTVVLTEPALIVVSLVGTTNSCDGAASGAADVSVAGGNDCQGYTYLWSNGATTEDLSNVAAGTYTVTVTDAQGCTGTQTVTVGAFAALNPSFTANGSLLTASQTWSTYQWILNGNNISGANANTFTATASGVYALAVTDVNGCAATSDTLSVTIVGISDPAAGLIGLSIYPNPARGEFKLMTEAPIAQSLTVTITDMFGRRYVQELLPSLAHEVAFDLSNYSAGSYLVEVVSKTGQRKVFRLIVQ